MMRPRWRYMVVVAVLTFMLFLPLRLVATLINTDPGGFSARQMSGSVWRGRIDDARFGAVDVGNVDVGLNPLPLLRGRARLGFRPVPGQTGNTISGAIEFGNGRRAIESLSGSVYGGTIGGLPIERIAFDALSVELADGECHAASGRVTLVIGIDIAGLNLGGGLSGVARCAGRHVDLPLISQTGMERIALDLAPDGTYTARLTVRGDDPLLATGLAASGFVADGGGFTKLYRGHL